MRLAALFSPRPARPAQPTADAALAAILLDLRAGRIEDAMEKVDASLQQGVRSAFLDVCRHTALQQKPTLAIHLLGLVGQSRPDLLPALARDPAFRTLRDDPRFLQLVGEL